MSSYSEGSEDETPEAVTFNTSKRRAREDESALQAFQSEEKRKKKERNRERDKALKERAVQSGKRGKAKEIVRDVDEAQNDGGSSRGDLEERMNRAMREAEEEEEEEESDSGEDDATFLNAELDVEGDSDDASPNTPLGAKRQTAPGDSPSEGSQAKKSRRLNYLPEHVFVSAFADSNTPSPKATSKRKQEDGDDKPRKKKCARNTSKDIVVGTRTIRTLSNPQDASVGPAVSSAGLRQPNTVKKFVKRTLNLKGSAAVAKTRGWERRPAHLGVMKRGGPAANFVRGS